MNKQVRMTARLGAARKADQWVETLAGPPSGPVAKPKRLTIDVDPELHTRLKLRCVTDDIPIADYLRRLIEASLEPTDS